MPHPPPPTDEQLRPPRPRPHDLFSSILSPPTRAYPARSPARPPPPPPTPSSRAQAVRAKWAMKGQRVTFFAARPGQAGLSNVFLGGYDPSNFNTTELCAVPAPTGSAGTAGRSAEGGGVLLGVAMGEVQLMTDPKNGQAEPESRVLRVATGTILAPVGQGHTVRPGGGEASSSSAPPAGSPGKEGKKRAAAGGLAVWYYVHSCPDGLFHLCVGFLSGAGWEQLYPNRVGAGRKGWTLELGVPK